MSDAAIANQWPAFNDEAFHYLQDNAIPAFPEFRARAHERLLRGKVEYGDRSFTQSEQVLLDEVMQELLDAWNWAFIAWCQYGDSIYLSVAAGAFNLYARASATAEFKAAKGG